MSERLTLCDLYLSPERNEEQRKAPTRIEAHL
jgi:hypothetical protein